MAVLKRALIPLAAAIAVALAAMGGLETMQEPPPAPVAELTWNAFAEGVDLKFHDAGGAVDYALRAVSQTRYNDGGIEWSRPILRWYENGAADWLVEAERGYVAPAGDFLNLSGDVALSRNEADGAALRLTTSLLRIDLASELAYSEEPVLMIADGLRQDAAGLLLNLPEDTVYMLGGVRGSHVRP